MKFMSIGVICLCLLGLVCWQSSAKAYLVQDGFENAWAGNYAPGWENTDYEWGPDSTAQMMQQTDIAHSGAHGMKLIAAAVPADWYWWVQVDNTNVDAAKMAKQYNPFISAWYYDDHAANMAGQLYSIPSNVYGTQPAVDDWTDVQLGVRYYLPSTDDYYYHTAALAQNEPPGWTEPGWQDTGVERSDGWHHLEMQLSSADGYIHFFIDDVEVGVSTRNDYVDLSTPSLSTMFQDPLSAWGSNLPYSYWDDFSFGSSYQAVPEPSSIIAILTGLAGLVTVRRLRK